MPSEVGKQTQRTHLDYCPVPFREVQVCGDKHPVRNIVNVAQCVLGARLVANKAVQGDGGKIRLFSVPYDMGCLTLVKRNPREEADLVSSNETFPESRVS